MCRISNHKLMPGISLGNHPIRRLFDAGLKVTVSTDDPISFGNTVTDEYVALAERGGFSRKELVQLAPNGFGMALLSEVQKKPSRYRPHPGSGDGAVAPNAPGPSGQAPPPFFSNPPAF